MCISIVLIKQIYSFDMHQWWIDMYFYIDINKMNIFVLCKICKRFCSFSHGSDHLFILYVSHFKKYWKKFSRSFSKIAGCKSAQALLNPKGIIGILYSNQFIVRTNNTLKIVINHAASKPHTERVMFAIFMTCHLCKWKS